MADANPSIIASLLQAVDKADRTFVETFYLGLIDQLKMYFVGLLMVYIIWWGYSIISGTATVSPLEAAERLAKVAFIYWISTNWSIFAIALYDITQYIPEELASRIVEAISTTTGHTVSHAKIYGMLGDLYAMMLQLPAIFYGGTVQDTFAGLFSLLVIVMTLLFLGAVLAGIIIAKVMLNIVLALGPVWIILALYNYSSRFTAGFLTITANLMVQQILIYGFLGFYYHLVIKALETAKNGEIGIAAADSAGQPIVSVVDHKLAYVMPLMLVMMVGFYVLIRLPALASTITGKTQQAATSISAAVARFATGWWRRTANTDAARPVYLSAADHEAARISIQRETARNSAAAL
ncbi:type IV secretion system protein [Mesorhizobium sp. RMAD-H1]|uniref:type IV secretion system protein n=1 Tax=Mesorhizobium sp. RMAD-H1 TaxID=2587065 RepID=UPI00161053B5|nr:type IV secretion system protein [Mesorhizobium sp. RMAD-H1]MBB2973353.1 type IV secretion system protein VirB6 [Mesorhizobium sp. RMAD-H1]